ncbi:MAG: hypothetical protein ACJ0Q9_05585 [Gammaproteobacteria bacterium]
MTPEIATFLVSGSGPKPYQVEFVKDDAGLKAYCNCLAGTHGSHCKHRINILAGDPSGIVSDVDDKFELISEWLCGTGLESALEEFLSAQKEKPQDRERVVKAKKSISKFMR